MPDEPTVMTEEDILELLGLKGRVKSLEEAKKLFATHDSISKEHGTFKKRFAEMEGATGNAGFKSFQEVLAAAIEGRKKPANGNGNGDFRTKMSDLYLKTYGAEEHGRLMKEDPRMFDFWATVLQDALSGIDTSKFLTQKQLDEHLTTIGDHLAERDFIYNLSPEDRARVKPFLKDIRRIYADDKLYNAPEGADDDYNGFAEGWKRHQEILKKAGLLKEEKAETKTETLPRRIAFAGKSGKPAEPLGGPARYDEIIRQNPEVLDAQGQIDDERFAPRPGA